MQTDDESAPQSPESNDADRALLPPASARHRWIFVAAMLIAAALCIWRCG